MNRTGLETEKGVAVPLRGVKVEASVLGAHARVLVKQHYCNEEANPVEAIYTFPLPSDATLTGFAMTCKGRRLDGQVRDREEAFREYDEALWKGHGAALLDQERANVFTASVGNLLPGEETVIEVEYIQRLLADEGALRFVLPTLVAPRYMPGVPAGDRTGGGWADPTTAVPDADRISPPIGDVRYGLALDLTFAVDADLEIESPSHAIRAQREADHWRVRFEQDEVALDRDIVIVARNVRQGPVTGIACHRTGAGPGTFALTVVPDLFDAQVRRESQHVVFVLDTSGSMDGSSLPPAKAALKLCLRHLREGDRFHVIEFNSTHSSFTADAVAFTQANLEKADQWVNGLQATGGTEILEPLVQAVRAAGDGIVVLLTDGLVGNEREVLDAVLEARGSRQARVFSLGIGTNISDALLRDLARRTGGAVESIHPGERIDEKVVAQFSRALARRVTDVALKFVDVEVSDLAPSPAPCLLDSEPWTLFGRYTEAGRGRVEIRGELDGEPFSLDVPVALAEEARAEALPKLWASERIRDLEASEIGARRSAALQQRIKQLAVEAGIASEYTSFVVVETREADRLATGQPVTRYVPVNAPAGWAMFHPVAPPAAVMSASPSYASAPRRFYRSLRGAVAFQQDDAAVQQDGPVVTLLATQLASGLWDEPGPEPEELRRVRATGAALWRLLEAGVTTSHAVHGSQVLKAVEALVHHATELAAVQTSSDIEAALAVAWLVASSRRVRSAVESAIRDAPALRLFALFLYSEPDLRALASATFGPGASKPVGHITHSDA